MPLKTCIAIVDAIGTHHQRTPSFFNRCVAYVVAEVSPIDAE